MSALTADDYARLGAERLREAVGRVDDGGLRTLEIAKGLVDAAIAERKRELWERDQLRARQSGGTRRSG